MLLCQVTHPWSVSQNFPSSLVAQFWYVPRLAFANVGPTFCDVDAANETLDVVCYVQAKAEFLNPGGSCKDRLARQVVLDAVTSGRLRAGQGTIVEGTSGSTGISLALVARGEAHHALWQLVVFLAHVDGGCPTGV